MTFEELLKYINDKAKNKREKGRLFEIAIKNFLKQSPEHNFENVWMWSEWPVLKKYKFKGDTGIDLVAKEREIGGFCAIQCKCFQEGTQVNKEDIDSFLGLAGKEPFKTKLIVTTTNNWSQNAYDATRDRTKPCKILTKKDLDDVPYDWNLRGGKPRKLKPQEHQKEALHKAKNHFKENDRGQMIMACGTGKTFTSLYIAEQITPQDGHILFLAPSISLISQSLRQYAYQRRHDQRYLVVCSDSNAGRETDGVDVDDLQIPPTTNPQKIAEGLKRKSSSRTVVFSTYQSLDQIKEAQELGAKEFDLVICDEAHRTTGIEAKKEEEGNFFTLINDKDYIKAYKRLYMTATPRLYSDGAKRRANKDQVELCSMDDEATYGKEFYRLDFSKAIEKKLLSDYKVIILTVDKKYISDHIQNALIGTKLNLDDGSKIVGCYKALKDQGKDDKGIKLSRAVAFLNKIHDSKECATDFSKVAKALSENKNDGFICKARHIDGTHNTFQRNEALEKLKKDAGALKGQEHKCRILFNAKCLTEGIDVPSLDAVLFLQPRKSQVDVVQAVGRVMRKAEGKKNGYVILPVVIPSDSDAVKALDNHDTYKVVWQVLNALRSHDNKFNAMINDIDLNKKPPEKFNIIGVPSDSSDTAKESINQFTSTQLSLLPPVHEKIYAKIVEKCGDRHYQDKWIDKVKDFYNTITTRINSLLEKDTKVKKEFTKYHKSLKSIIHAEISQKEAVSMLAEHLLTKRAFDKIFDGYEFSKENPISKAMDKTIQKLQGYALENEVKELETFYNSISKRIEGVDNSSGRQTIIKELYEGFIKTAFPKTAEKLGIAYTPVEIVDFILNSADLLLKQEFKKGLTDKDVHILDAFAGTGIFINRLIDNKNLILDKDLQRKFNKELHANEILLLPYYMASINIEEAYHNRIKGDYKPFPGMVLTDTFNMVDAKQRSIEFDRFKDNNERIERQKQAPIQVIVGNPPYSVGQKNENDGNKNASHPELEHRIKETYVKESTVQNKNALYDSYIKAIRWASDRVEKQGIIGFVHNASLVDSRSTVGLRKCLVKEFDAIYCFNLRGDQRTKGENSRKEGGKIFGSSSRVPVAITFLVKHSEASSKKDAVIKYYDIGDYLKREKKLKIIQKFKSVKGVKWETITPGPNGDWINQRGPGFDKFLPLGDKKSKGSIFDLYSSGVCTGRDSWTYSFSKNQVKENMQNMIKFYNQELERLQDKKITKETFKNTVNRDKEKIKWSSSLIQYFIRQKRGEFDKEKIRVSSYRPFTKPYLYFNRGLNERVRQNPKIFPEVGTKNKVICVSGIGSNTFSVLITNHISDYGYLGTTQCFPFYYYDTDSKQISFEQSTKRKHSITDFALKHFRDHYKDQKITKKDIFYYIYGLLHSKDYQEKYKNNLTKDLPRIPCVPHFKDLSKIGKQLADLHLNYEDQKQNQKVLIKKEGQKVTLSNLKPEDLKVKKMKLNKNDQSKIQFNENITIENIPAEAWNYEINGRSAIKWVMERYQVKTDKDSQITNNPNDFSDNPAYILNLLLSVITVSLETQKLIASLPSIDFDKLAKEKLLQDIEKMKKQNRKKSITC